MADTGTRNLRRAISRTGAPGRTIALLLIFALPSGLFWVNIESRVRNENDSVIALQTLRGEISTAQSSVRGYTLVGTPRVLEPYRVAVPAVREAIDDANSVMGDDNRERIDSVEKLFGDWQRRFAEPMIAFVRNRQDAEAAALARTEDSERMIDRIRVLLADEIADEEQEIRESQRVERFLGVVAVVAIAVLCLAVGITWRTRQRDLAPGNRAPGQT